MKSLKGILENKLNALLEKNCDAEAGFKKVAENIQDSTLRKAFIKKANERREFINELEKELESYNMEYEEETSLTSDLHRFWIDAKSVLSKQSSEAILEEVVRGEEKALEEYDSVIKETNLLAPTKEMLLKQRSKIATSLSTMALLENLAE